MGSIIGRRIDYNGVGALRGQRHILKINPSTPGVKCTTTYDASFNISKYILLEVSLRLYSVYSVYNSVYNSVNLAIKKAKTCEDCC